MRNPFTWYKEYRSRKIMEKQLSELVEKWRKFVWEWHVPLQKESIAARGPFMRTLEAEKENASSGEAIGKRALQTAFAAICEEMNAFDERIVEAFIEWYQSDPASTWKDEFRRLGVEEEFMAIATDILLGASRTTLNICVINSREVIEDDELLAQVMSREDANAQ